MRKEISTEIRRYYSFWHGINILYEEWAHKYGISSNTLYTLYAIWDNPQGCTQKKISEDWLMPKQTVCTILKKLEEKGYIRYEVLDEDRRNKQIFLTAPGQEMADRLIGKLCQIENEAMNRMGKENSETLLAQNELLMHSLQKEMGKGK